MLVPQPSTYLEGSTGCDATPVGPGSPSDNDDQEEDEHADVHPRHVDAVVISFDVAQDGTRPMGQIV